MTHLPEEVTEARRLFELVRPLWHYAKKGTPDGAMFERSEQGRFLMRSMEKIAAMRAASPPPDQDQVEAVARAMRFWTHGEADIRGRFSVHGPTGSGTPLYFDSSDDAYAAARELNATAALLAIKASSAP